MHWTYEPPAGVSRAGLCQGDLIERTDDLNALLAEVHPYFVKPKYLHFMVVTQSCDLVRRDGSACKAEYITLATVRSVDDALDRELERVTRPRTQAADAALTLCDREYVSDEARPQFVQAVERILNNTHEWYFYLRADKDAGLGDDCCAFLRVTVSLQAQHYDLLLRAKRAQLRPVFQARVGDLVGSLYSRVATEDWSEDDVRRAQFKDLRKQFVESIRWLPRAKFREVLKILRIDALPETTASVEDALKRRQVRSKERREAVLLALDESWPADVDPVVRRRVRSALENNPTFASGVREGE